MMREAAGSGEYNLPRLEGSDHVTPVDGMTATVMTRIDQVRPSPAGEFPQRHRP